MGFQSQSGQVGLKTQAAKGAFLDPGAADPNDGIFMQLRGGALGADRELIIPDPEIGGGRDITAAVLGPVAYSGEYEFYARMESLATIINAAFGSTSTTPSGVTYGDDLVGVHVITPIDTSALPWLSIEETVGDGLESFNYTDARVNSFSMECEPDGYLMGTVGMIALTQTAGNTATASPEWDTTPLLVGTSMTVTIGGLTTYIVRDFSMDFTNNIEDDVFSLGSLTLQDLTAKRRELTTSFTIRPDDIDLWREAVYGSSVATSPLSGAAAQKDVNINIQSFEDIGTGVSTKFELDIDIPFANIQPFGLEPNGDDVIEFGIEMQALRPTDASPLCTITVTNGFDEIK